MTKIEAIAAFCESYLPAIVKAHGIDCADSAHTDWLLYTDSLCKDGKITDNQRCSWDSPTFTLRQRADAAVSAAQGLY